MASFVLTSLSFFFNIVSNEPLPGVGACAITQQPYYYYAIWIGPMIFEFFLLCLVLYYIYNRLRLFGNWHRNGLIDIMIHDNILYFVA